MTIEHTFSFIEAKKTGKKLAAQMLTHMAVGTAIGSTYKHQKRSTIKRLPPKEQDICSHCGKKAYG